MEGKEDPTLWVEAALGEEGPILTVQPAAMRLPILAQAVEVPVRVTHSILAREEELEPTSKPS